MACSSLITFRGDGAKPNSDVRKNEGRSMAPPLDNVDDRICIKLAIHLHGAVMPINVNNPEADALTRKFAQMAGVTITEAIVIAMKETIASRCRERLSTKCVAIAVVRGRLRDHRRAFRRARG